MIKNSSKKLNKYKYRIILDPEKDAWNWLDSCGDNSSGSSHGVDWSKRASDDVLAGLKGKSDEDARTFIVKYLKQKYIDESEKIEKFKQLLKKRLDKDLSGACEKLEKVMGKPIYRDNFTIYLTTFPRGPYNYYDGSYYEYISWNNPIMGFLHELSHFQFIHYWRNNPNSDVSKLANNQFQWLKESLTIILDEDLLPLIECVDIGYEIHMPLRKELHKFWEKNHNFDKLVKFELKILPKYYNAKIDNPKTIFKQLKTPQELLDFMDANINYGFVGKNGKVYLDQNDDWQKNWESECIVQSGNGLLKTNCGTCWDQVELERKWFLKHNYQFKTIFSWFEINKPNNYPTHTFLAFQDGSKWYWFEHSFGVHKGIHEFNSLDKLINDIKDKQLESAIDFKIAKSKDRKLMKSYLYSKPKINLRVNDYINHVKSGRMV